MKKAFQAHGCSITGIGLAGILTLLSGCQTHNTQVSLNTEPAELTLIGRYASDQYHRGAAEIVAWHNGSHSVFVVNSASGTVDILDASGLSGQSLADPLTVSNLSLKHSLHVQSDIPALELGAANSITVKDDFLAVAVENSNKQSPGIVAFYAINSDGIASYKDYVEVGALPDMVTITPDGRYVLVANEGEPSKDYRNDPEGSVSIITLKDFSVETVRTVRFSDFNAGSSRANDLPADVRIFGRNASVAQDLEPEYIAVSPDSSSAYVSLQENNAFAIIDIKQARVKKIAALGFKDYGQFPIDASDKDKSLNIQPWSQVYGMYQPDTITAFEHSGKTFVVSANEGDARDYWYEATSMTDCLASGGLEFDEEDGCLGFSEEARAGKLVVSSTHPHVEDVKDKGKLGRLKVTTTLGDGNQDGEYETLYSYGGRSFSIWDEEGKLVFDSGDDFERITAELLGENFNNTDDKTKGDSRSDDKGPEPEAVAVGSVNGRTYAFIGLERTGGIFMYDISNPYQPEYISYTNNRNFAVDAESQTGLAGDLSPEGMVFVSGDDSPTGKALLVVGHEVSGSTAIYQVE